MLLLTFARPLTSPVVGGRWEDFGPAKRVFTAEQLQMLGQQKLLRDPQFVSNTPRTIGSAIDYGVLLELLSWPPRDMLYGRLLPSGGRGRTDAMVAREKMPFSKWALIGFLLDIVLADTDGIGPEENARSQLVQIFLG